MTKPNNKIYPLVHLYKEDYNVWASKIKELGVITKTEISYNFYDQCFEIQGKSQNSCDEAAVNLIQKLLPLINRDASDFENTFPSFDVDLEDELQSSMGRSSSHNSLGSPRESVNSPTVMRVSGRTLLFDDLVINDKNKKNNNQHSNEEEEKVYVYHGDTESDYESDEDEEEYEDTFVFAKNIPNPSEILNSTSSVNYQPNYFLREVENATNTQCHLIEKEMKVSGSTREDVDDAISRFKNLQTLYKRRRKPNDIIACVSPPAEKMKQNFGLYFADLECYRYQHLIFIPGDIRNNKKLFVILPVWKDKNGNNQKPRDLIESSVGSNRNSPTGYQIQQQYEQQQQSYQQQEQHYPSQRRSSQRSQDKAHQSTWGQNRYTSSRSLVSEQWSEHVPVRPTSSSSGYSTMQNYSGYYSSSAPPVSTSSQDDFPSLPMKQAKKPSIQPPGKEMKRRVLQINNQKASSNDVEQLGSFLEKLNLDPCFNNTFYEVKKALSDGLEYARGVRGNIKFGAKLGHVLWSNITPEMQKTIWPYSDLNSVLIKQKKVKPFFNHFTTTDEFIIDRVKENIPNAVKEIIVFEIHAKARNQPSLPYQDVIIIINPGSMDIKDVILRRDYTTQANVVSLDKKFDYQMYVTTEELGRKDVKPFSTFLKTLSINTTNMEFSYENIPEFLQVTHVFFKQSSRHRLLFPFVTEITTVELLPSIPQNAIGFIDEKLMASPGTGRTWYDLEVFYHTHSESFKSNLDIGVGKLASWTVDDILGQQGTDLFDYMNCLVQISNNINEFIED